MDNERANPERDDGRVLEESFFDGYAALEKGSVDCSSPRRPLSTTTITTATPARTSIG